MIKSTNDGESVKQKNKTLTVITAGSTYLDIDAYACCVAMAELLRLKGKNAIAYSFASCNYSVCKSLVTGKQVLKVLPPDYCSGDIRYIIVDVSDPNFIKDVVPLEQIIEVYDHHAGFEEYWTSRIGDKAHIEFIGAAATLIYREWKLSGLQEKISHSTAKLLIAAILDNTLNLTSSNVTQEDVETFNELCERENIDKKWCSDYFSEVQTSIESDLKNALFGDIKTIRENNILPHKIAQISVWDAQSILDSLPKIRGWFAETTDTWMINVIDICHRCSYFVCDDSSCQKRIEKIFDVHFESGIAKSSVSYLRKEIIKKTIVYN